MNFQKLSLPFGHAVHLLNALPNGLDEKHVLKDDPAGVFQPAERARGYYPKHGFGPKEPPNEVVNGDYGRGCNEHPPIPINCQEGQRSENVEMCLDPAPGEMDEQSSEEHLGD